MSPKGGLDFLISSDDAPSKQEILRVALDLFVRDGLCATSLRDIAAASGYSSTVLYKFFASKEALASYLFDRCYALLALKLRHRLDPASPFLVNVRTLMRSAGEMVVWHTQAVLYVSEHIRLMWPSLSEQRKRDSLAHILTELFAQGAREGVIKQKAEIPYLVAVFMGSLSQYAKLAYFQESSPAAEEGVQALSRILERVLGDSAHG